MTSEILDAGHNDAHRILAIGTARGIRNLVFADGIPHALGRVEKRSRLAAGQGGKFGTFWTATVLLDGKPVGPSLGTRHRDQWSAARAIRQFHRTNPLVSKGFLDRATVSQLASTFKWREWETCALPSQGRAYGCDPAIRYNRYVV